MELLELASTHNVRANSLQLAHKKHMQSFIELYGDDIVPKWHYAFHLADKIASLMNCFVLERKHRVAKRVANSMHDTSAEYEVT